MEIAHPERCRLDPTPHQRSTGEGVEEARTDDDDGGNGRWSALGRLWPGRLIAGMRTKGGWAIDH